MGYHSFIVNTSEKSNPTFSQVVGARLRTARQAMQFTQLELATRLGLSRAYVASVEGGRKGTSLRRLVVWSRCLCVSIDELVEGL